MSAAAMLPPPMKAIGWEVVGIVQELVSLRAQRPRYTLNFKGGATGMEYKLKQPARLDADKSFGILTLATPNDYPKAIGLALSARVSNPGIPLAVACSAAVAAKLEPYFDYIVIEKPGLRGFVHKVYLDVYTPFETTFFFDSDVLLFRSLLPYLEQWNAESYSVVGRFVEGGVSAFGLDIDRVIERLGVDRMVSIDGAGHVLFRKPSSEKVFERAREITSRYSEYAGAAKYADEDVMAIVLTELKVTPMEPGEFFSVFASPIPGTLRMDSRIGLCEYLEKRDRSPAKPCMMHFVANGSPLRYGLELCRLFRAFGVSWRSLVPMILKDFYVIKIRWPLGEFLKRLTAR
jgi:hypothetical protein